MKNKLLEDVLSDWLSGRFAAAFPGSPEAASAGRVAPSARPEFGDYQCSDAMGLARALRMPPRKIAEAVVAGASLPGVVAKLEIAGAGFINITLEDSAIAAAAAEIGADSATRGIPQSGAGRTLVIDYSSPNVAKPMHIGHIRSTVIGGAIDALHRALGYRVIADNHIGDWGTQFGIIIRGYREFLDRAALDADPVEELQRIYVESYARAKADPAWMEECRGETVKLQRGDPENRALWQEFIRLSRGTFDEIYSRLGVKFDTTRGESYYNDRLAGVVETLEKHGLAKESEGATIVDLSDEGLDVAIVRKRDGGFNYTTTDIATVAVREEDYAPDKIVYVTDERQQLHFRQFFSICRKIGAVRADCGLVHVWFGLMRLPEGTISTRQGNLIKLKDLLDEAHRRALAIVRKNHADWPEDEQHELAEIIGCGAVKYADLSQDPRTLITFTWDKAMSLDGNSGPYLQYACARIRSVLAKFAEAFPGADVLSAPIVLGDAVERELALKIAAFPGAVKRAAESYRPCVLAEHLHGLAQAYSSFYQSHPFLKAEPGVRESRVHLCALAAAALEKGLSLLGIRAPERM